MELKKNPSKDLSKWKGALNHLGLAMSIGAVLVAFEWKTYEESPQLTITDQNSKWDEGNIYDPKNGNTYSCTIKLINPNSLEVRGYIGVSMLGRSTVWIRTNSPNP